MQNEDDGENYTTLKSTPSVRHKTSKNHQSQSLGLYLPKIVKVDFPRYEGKMDPTIRLCKAEQFFELHQISATERVPLASFHMDGEANLWYQLLRQELSIVS